MSTLVMQPWDVWSDPVTTHREGTPFASTWTSTRDLLRAEVDRLQLRGVDQLVVVQLHVAPAQIRKDGALRADVRVDEPGVIVSFDSVHGPLRYACDRFVVQGWRGQSAGAAWQHNLRAIALGLEALRKVSRYGIGARGEQYTGWAQIGTGREMPAAMSRDVAERVLTVAAGVLPGGEMTWRDVYRRAAMNTHPDHGGSHDAAAEVTAAWAVINPKESAA